MFFIDQLKQANDATLAATHQNACKIAAEDVPQGEGDRFVQLSQEVRVITALKVIDSCKDIIRERIREQGPDGTMADAILLYPTK